MHFSIQVQGKCSKADDKPLRNAEACWKGNVGGKPDIFCGWGISISSIEELKGELADSGYTGAYIDFNHFGIGQRYLILGNPNDG